MLSVNDRNMVRQYYLLGFTDEQIAKAIGAEVREVGEARRDMGFKRPRGAPTKPKTETEPQRNRKYRNLKADQILVSYAKQLGGKNMAEVASEFGVSREYVRQRIDSAYLAGILDEHGFFASWDIKTQLGIEQE